MPPPSANILILVANLPVPADRRVWQEACALAQNGYTVHIICPRTKGFKKFYDQQNNIHVYRFWQPFEGVGLGGFICEYTTLFLSTFLLGLYLQCRHRLRIVQICNPPDLFFIIAWLLKQFGASVVYDQHDVCPELYASKFTRKPRFFSKITAFMFWLEKQTYRCADRVIVPNESFHHVAQTRGKIDPQKIFIVRHTPDSFFPAACHHKNNTYTSQPPVIGYVGILGSQDGGARLIEIARLLKEKKPALPFKMIIVGDGPELAQVKHNVLKFNLASTVIFKGFVSGDELISAYRSFDIAIIPDAKNTYTDLITLNKTLEYIAMNIPFVYPPLTQTICDAENAGLCAENDSVEALCAALIHLIDHHDVRECLKQNAIKRLDDLAWHHSKNNLLACYHSLVAPH